MTNRYPTLSDKMERLVAFYHRRDEPELTADELARRLGHRLGRPVASRLLEDARAGVVATLPLDLAHALCDEVGVDRAYLTERGGADIDIDQRLRLWITIRDRGLDHFAARAHDLDRDALEHLIREVEDFPVDRTPAG